MSDPLITNRCHGLDCASSDLIEAHVIPKAFARFVRGNGRTVEVQMKKSGYAKRQLGVFDRNILCKTCDGKLGIYDQYAVEVCCSFEETHRRQDRALFELPGVDGERLALFVLAVLWRGSISKLDGLAEVSFGKKYEAVAREVLFGARSLASFREFAVLMLRYTSPYIDIDKFYTLPIRTKFDELNSYGFGLGGFRFVAKLDARPFAPIVAPLILNQQASPRGSFIELENTSEFERMTEMMVAHHRRGHVIL